MTKQKLSTGRVNQWAWVVLVLGSLSLGRCGLAFGQQESVALRARHVTGGASRVTITLDVRGVVRQDLQVASPAAKPLEQTMELPVGVAGRLMYDEVLRGSGGPETTSTQSVRQYHHAEANIQVGKQADQIKLRTNRRLIVATADDGLLYAVDGPISREELDLIEVPGNSLVLDRLLPNREVRVGEKWMQDNDVLTRLLNCDEVSNGEITCQLTELAKGLAIVSLTGSIAGRADSAETSIQLRGEFRYDVHWGRITWLQMDTTEIRHSGLVQPGFQVTTELRLRVEPLQQAAALSAKNVEAAWHTNPKSNSLLLLEPRASAVKITHDRRWHMTGDFPRRTVMRCLDHGELLAQLNVTELAKLPAGRELSLEEFQTEIQAALGDQFRRFVSATKQQANGHRELRVVTTGVVDDLPIHWIYYHVNDSSGRRAAHVYILESKNVEAFNGVDQEMVARFEFAPRPGSNDASASATVHADAATR